MISQRVGRYLERQGLLVRDIENSYLQLEALDDSVMNDLLGHSITYRIAVGPQAGRKAFTHIILEPLDFIARLATLVPKPRVNLTRFHGVFAPNSRLRSQVTPARRGRRCSEAKTFAPRHVAVSLWPSASNGCSRSISKPAATAVVPSRSSPVSKTQQLSKGFLIISNIVLNRRDQSRIQSEPLRWPPNRIHLNSIPTQGGDAF